MKDTQVLEPLNQTVIDVETERLQEKQFVIDQVLQQLGRPANLTEVRAENVWGRNYRVNVYCSQDMTRPVATLYMTDSFFVTLEDGQVVGRPPIVRRYEAN